MKKKEQERVLSIEKSSCFILFSWLLQTSMLLRFFLRIGKELGFEGCAIISNGASSQIRRQGDSRNDVSSRVQNALRVDELEIEESLVGKVRDRQMRVEDPKTILVQDRVLRHVSPKMRRDLTNWSARRKGNPPLLHGCLSHAMHEHLDLGVAFLLLWMARPKQGLELRRGNQVFHFLGNRERIHHLFDFFFFDQFSGVFLVYNKKQSFVLQSGTNPRHKGRAQIRNGISSRRQITF